MTLSDSAYLQDHEIAAGQALLDGQGLPAAQRAEEAVKKAQQ